MNFGNALQVGTQFNLRGIVMLFDSVVDVSVIVTHSMKSY